MELTQITYFIAAAEKMHFGLAAESLGIAQPSLSRGIQLLEKELQTELFDRSNKRKIKLTASGKTFFQHALQIREQLAAAKRNAREAAAGTRGHLSIGALESALERREFLNTLTRMQQKYPEITLEIIDDHSCGLAEKIKQGSIDLAICRYDDSFEEQDHLICRKLFDDLLILAFSKNHRFAQLDKIHVRDLKDEKLILVPEKTSPAYFRCIRTMCKEAGNFQLQSPEGCSNFYTAQHLAEAGFGVAIVPASHENLFPAHLYYRRIADFTPKSSVCTVWQDDSSTPALQSFLQILRNSFHNT